MFMMERYQTDWAFLSLYQFPWVPSVVVCLSMVTYIQETETHKWQLTKSLISLYHVSLRLYMALKTVFCMPPLNLMSGSWVQFLTLPTEPQCYIVHKLYYGTCIATRYWWIVYDQAPLYMSYLIRCRKRWAQCPWEDKTFSQESLFSSKNI